MKIGTSKITCLLYTSRLEIPPSHLCLMQGPFPQELECAFLRHWKITFVVMKDSGKEGGTEEKLAAARQCGVEAVVIQRPPEPDGFLLTELEQKLFQEFGSTIAVGGKNCLLYTSRCV